MAGRKMKWNRACLMDWRKEGRTLRLKRMGEEAEMDKSFTKGQVHNPITENQKFTTIMGYTKFYGLNLVVATGASSARPPLHRQLRWTADLMDFWQLHKYYTFTCIHWYRLIVNRRWFWSVNRSSSFVFKNFYRLIHKYFIVPHGPFPGPILHFIYIYRK